MTIIIGSRTTICRGCGFDLKASKTTKAFGSIINSDGEIVIPFRRWTVCPRCKAMHSREFTLLEGGGPWEKQASKLALSLN